MKYESYLVTFTEVPDEISLCLNISGCPCHCEGCFEPWLREDIGTPLTQAVLEALIDAHPHITCVCFMGGDGRYAELAELITAVKFKYPKLKWAMYSGIPGLVETIGQHLDYYKIGPYKPECGPLNCKTTNQKFFKKESGDWVDITSVFQKEKI